MQTLMTVPGQLSPPVIHAPQLFITNTLGNPFIEEETLGRIYEPIAKSRRDANKIKKSKPITVVIGNPPYKNKGADLGGWIEKNRSGRSSAMDLWTPPSNWGLSAHTHHLKNLYVYFWRWATLKVFGSDWHEVTGEADIDRSGIICFITAAGFLNGPGFQKMRADLRRDASEIWVIDCSPEGHQPEVPTRIFAGVQQPICIVLVARRPEKSRLEEARLNFNRLPKGTAKIKLTALAELSLSGDAWLPGASGWREAFLPDQEADWTAFPSYRSDTYLVKLRRGSASILG